MHARADLTQAHRLDDARFPVGHVLERFASPESQCLAISIDSAIMVTPKRVAARIRDEPFEADGVDRFSVDPQTIIGRFGEDRVMAESPPDPRDRVAYLLRPRGWQSLTPPRLRQLGRRHRGGAAHDQSGEDSALAWSERCRPGLEWPQHLDDHEGSVPPAAEPVNGMPCSRISIGYHGHRAWISPPGNVSSNSPVDRRPGENKERS